MINIEYLKIMTETKLIILWVVLIAASIFKNIGHIKKLKGLQANGLTLTKTKKVGMIVMINIPIIICIILTVLFTLFIFHPH
jgi:hypothetical protein